MATEINQIAIVQPPPAPIVAKKIEPSFTKTSGFKTRTIYSCKILDIDALRSAAIQDTSLLKYLIADEKALNTEAADKKEEFTIPGCELVRRVV